MWHVILDGTLIESDRVAGVRENGNDWWFSQKHKAFGGNIQFLSAPDGTPLWVCDVEPGSTPDITTARIHALPALYKAAADGLRALTPDVGHQRHLDLDGLGGQESCTNSEHRDADGRRSGSHSGSGTTASAAAADPVQVELAAARKRIRELEEEHDILRKAARYFAGQTRW